MWFDTWSDLVRVVLVGGAAYVTLVVLLRLTGKRTLGKFNAFDLVVTVALGSVLATILLNADVSWSEGALALLVLSLLQLAVAWISAHTTYGRGLVTSRPLLLCWQGEIRYDALVQARMTVSEVLQACRQSGQGDVADAGAVVLESNGQVSVIARSAMGKASALADVKGVPQEVRQRRPTRDS